MIIDTKKYIISVVIFLSILLIFLATTNYYIDPLSLFNKENKSSTSKTKLFYEKTINSKYGVYLDEKKFSFREVKKFFALNNQKKECAIIGSSVVDMINGSVTNNLGEDLSNLKDQCSSVLNLSVPQSVYEDYFAFTYLLLQNPNPPKKIIFNIDPHSFTKYNYLWDYFSNEYYAMYNLIFSDNNNQSYFFTEKNKLKRNLENILSFEYFLISIKQFFFKNEFLPEEAEYFNPSKGSDKIHVIFSDGSGVTERKLIEKKNFNVTEDFRIVNGKYFQEKTFQDFEKLILYLKKNFEVMLLLVPRHVNNFSTKHTETLNALNFIENKVYNLSKKNNITLLGSYNPNKLNCKNDEFINYLYAKYSCLKKIKEMN